MNTGKYIVWFKTKKFLLHTIIELFLRLSPPPRPRLPTPPTSNPFPAPTASTSAFEHLPGSHWHNTGPHQGRAEPTPCHRLV
jgi:hypothetical protein